MKKRRPLIKDNHARIPFSIIGIFLILGSSFTTVYITNLEVQKAEEISSTMDFNEVEYLINFFEADLSTALNLAALKGMKDIGSQPVKEVTDPVNNPYSDGQDDPDLVNKNRVREIIKEELNIYLTTTYLYDYFNDGQYSINIVIPPGETYPITDRSTIDFEPKEMELHRTSVPVIGPTSTPTHDTYWVASLPLQIEISEFTNDGKTKPLTTKTVNIETLVTSRLPLLEELTNEYETIIGEEYKPLWTLTTILVNLYSLARGFKHNKQGEPMNVVENDHIAPMINGGLLLEQGFTFGSADPLSIVEFGLESANTLRGKNKNSLGSTFDSYTANDATDATADSNDFTKAPANKDAGETNLNKSIPDNPDLNLKEIAYHPLEEVTYLQLIFINQGTGLKVTPPAAGFDPTGMSGEEIQDEINQIITDQTVKGNRFHDIDRTYGKNNQTTINKLKQIADDVHTADFKTKITHSTPVITIGKHKGYPVNMGYTPWQTTMVIPKSQTGKPPKGTIKPGDTLFSETCEVHYKRAHTWATADVPPLIVVKTDTKVEYRSKYEIILNKYSEYIVDRNNLENAFYSCNNHGIPNITYDLNLQDTINTYKTLYVTPNLYRYFEKTGIVHTKEITGNYDSQLIDEGFYVLHQIRAKISEIKQDPYYNATNFPNPFELMEKIRDDLRQKYQQNFSLYKSKNTYYDFGTGNYKSAANKAICIMRQWYVNEVNIKLNRQFNRAQTKMSDKINEEMQNAGGNVDADQVKSTLSDKGAIDAVKNQFNIPFGYDMSLTGEWDESIKLAIDQKPNYLHHKNVAKPLQMLGIKTTCLLGPTGFPLLPPTPVTPWIVTANSWLVEVKGEYEEFKVVDSTDETIFNPLFGHDPQIYIREQEFVYDEKGNEIGTNTRLGFEWSTLAFSVAPPWGLMVGDTALTELIETDGLYAP